ncbi:MAG: arsenosugar biosynthesis radical SAM protein ArsS [Planctomycetes bacterium]|nr:arsenosugar biosynthesis radical SAM protein ArsS [Planctomycetota bacterium]
MERIDSRLLGLDNLQILQVNLGNKCNQRCEHCHVQAGPDGQKVMSREVMLKIIDFLRRHEGLVLDITGGCPELNPDFKFFVDSVCGLASCLMVRTNLTVFFEAGLEWVPAWYAEHKVALVASLPCYTEENVDKQRGQGVFEKSIKALKMLNELGYGCDWNLELNLVYNPGGDFLPGSQDELGADYKSELDEKYGVRFNNLFTITNAPIGRFRQYLEANGQLEQYQQLLKERFNSEAAWNIMCRRLLSIDYRGVVYNCDFNQAIGLSIINGAGKEVSIEHLEDAISGGIEIITGEHCFCCTAGAGSSCTGSLLK